MLYSKLNCCDYDLIEHYESGTFCSKYKTELSDKIRKSKTSVPLSPQMRESFKNQEYTVYVTTAKITLYRVFGQIAASNKPGETIKGARALGSFASTEFAESKCDSKMRLALDPAWLNTQMYEERLEVPKDQIIIVGTVAKITLKSGAILPGGADQIILPQNWPESWIQGYRRVTSRQLKSPPKYTLEKPPLFDTKGAEGEILKNKLFRPICPRCCSENTRKLTDEEQFTIIGSKGGIYTMFYTCLEEDCQYYW